ncbi:uncharacterized protein LOC134269873 isoform X2 [Saccostrea cucullata]|uniref:uncharacterized protein LOC134269873 isoform X2 n=1 Tax=Saccostrea cuccullata TaxID=36930 RepID=UPI002ED0956B
MGLKQRCMKCLYFSCLLNIGLIELKDQSSSLHYMGEFPYRNALSFVKGNQSCGVPSQKFLSVLKREVHDQDESVSDYTCLLFLDDDQSEDNSVLRIRDVHVEVNEYEVQYKFRLNPFHCNLEKDFQNVNLFLTFFQRKANRKYNESCGMHSQCYKNTICTQTERRKFLCLCKKGFEFVNGDCIKVDIALSMECVDSRQCKEGRYLQYVSLMLIRQDVFVPARQN